MISYIKRSRCVHRSVQISAPPLGNDGVSPQLRTQQLTRDAESDALIRHPGDIWVSSGPEAQYS